MSDMTASVPLFAVAICLCFASMACNCPELVRFPPSATTLTVKRQCDLKKAVLAGNYDYFDQELAEPENFPTPTGCTEGEPVEVHLFRTSELIHYPCKSHTHKIVEFMEERGYTPADWTVFFSLGAERPEMQRQSWIAGLGSRWWDSEGYMQVPLLAGDAEMRVLALAPGRQQYGWCDGYFAAVRR